MPCSKCKSEFTLFNWKIKCGECEDKYCNKCLKRKEGVLYCEVCLILIKRPPDRTKLMELKVKELRDYLNKNNISTYGLVEKKELVDLFCNKQIPEKQRRGVDKLTANFENPLKPINGFFNNLETVITEQRVPNRQTPSTTISQPSRVEIQQSETSAPGPSAPPYEELPTTSQDFSNSQTQSSKSQQITPDDSPLPKRYPKLEDFHTSDDLEQLSSKQLKIILSMNRVDFKGCLEKHELLEKVQRLWKDNNHNKSLSEDTPIQELCKLCMDAPLDCVLLECGHITSCIECGKKLAECPICRQYVVRVVRTFKA